VVDSYDLHAKTRNGHFYSVPLYCLRLIGRDQSGVTQYYDFKAIRFGVCHDGAGPDYIAGHHGHSVSTLHWDPFLGGSWHLRYPPFHQVYLHRGAESPLRMRGAFGAAGCIEVTGQNEWQRFNQKVCELSGSSDLGHISAQGNFKCELLHTHRPHLQELRLNAA
jgi:hypothetical protein